MRSYTRQNCFVGVATSFKTALEFLTFSCPLCQPCHSYNPSLGGKLKILGKRRVYIRKNEKPLRTIRLLVGASGLQQQLKFASTGTYLQLFGIISVNLNTTFLIGRTSLYVFNKYFFLILLTIKIFTFFKNYLNKFFPQITFQFFLS